MNSKSTPLAGSFYRLLGLSLFFLRGLSVFAAESDSTSPPSSPPQPKAATSSPSGAQRNFYEVLDDLLGDFEYDLKNGNVGGLKDLSIRNIWMSENIPASFRNHLELLITEKILKTSKTRVIQCLPCKAKKTTFEGDRIKITSTDSNPAELAQVAKASGISRFMDLSFMYQPTGMILSIYTVDPETGSFIWSQAYNSETSRAAAFRRGVDYNQLDEARRSTEYVPTIQYRLIFYYLSQPAVPVRTGVLALGYRMMERYDNRKKEVGFELNYMVDASSIVNKSGIPSTNYYKAYGLNLTGLFLHSWNFIGEEENYNRVRGSLTLGVGGTYASGYLSALFRSVYEWRLGKRFTFSGILGYRPLSTAFVGASESGKVSGLEYGIGVNLLF